MSLLSSGDFVDKVFLSGTETISKMGESVRWWTLSAWDQDDFFSPCRNDGEFAFRDPYQLVYCAQSRLDQVIFANSILYSRYVDTLEALLVVVDQEKFEAALLRTRDDLLDHFRRPEVLEAMSELLSISPAAKDYTTAKQELLNAQEKLERDFKQRRDFIVKQIANYRLESAPDSSPVLGPRHWPK